MVDWLSICANMLGMQVNEGAEAVNCGTICATKIDFVVVETQLPIEAVIVRILTPGVVYSG